VAESISEIACEMGKKEVELSVNVVLCLRDYLLAEV
jgi:hypothetical protein